MIMAKETELLKAQVQFEEMVEFFRQASDDALRLDQLERGLWQRLLAMGLAMLEAFVAQAGDGDVGETIERDGQTLRRIDALRSRRYVSIFGAVAISRRAYAVREKQQEHAPLDSRLGLPEDEFSYVLKDWLQQSCVRDAFAEAVKWLGEMLGLPLSVRSAEQINQRLAKEVEQFRWGQPVPPPREEAEVLVVTADGKGVPMRRPVEERIRQGVRRRKGEKANKKQMAAVGAVYTIAPFVRTADDVIDEVQRRERAAERPRPQHKQVWAELSQMREGEQFSGKERLFAEMAVQAHERDPHRRKPLVCLMDGEPALWEMQREWLPRAVGVLDLFHVLEWLWDVAHCVHGEGSEEAEAFVTHRLCLLLTGKVGYMIGGLRRLVAQSDLRGEKRRRVQRAIGYFDRNREHMRYDEYLAAGYPIGSGVAEGACRHLVKDRMERTGMRWTVHGAQAMLNLRSVYLNGDWKDYVTDYIATEQTALYGQRAA
jgi:hypothetical protein